jgi:C-terminal processing protease CtpA/Prc
MRPRLLPVLAAGMFFAVGVVNDSPRAEPYEPQQTEVDSKAALFARHLAQANHILAEGHITPTSDAKMVQWAVEGLYKEVKKPLPADIAKRLTELDKATKEELLAILQDVRARLGSRKDLEDYEDVEICLRAVFLELEPGAQPEDRSCTFKQEFLCIQRSYEPMGIGLKIESDKDTGMLRVITPILNGPAYKAGIRGGDLITQIRLNTDGAGKLLWEPKIVSTKGLSVEEAERLFLGKEGTRVILTVIPAGTLKDLKKD